MDGQNFPIGHDQNWGFSSINMEDMLMSIYSDPESYTLEDSDGAASGEPAMILEDLTGASGMSPAAGVPGIAAESSSAVVDGREYCSGTAAEEFAAAAVDKAAQRKLRRMRKNRESAARSRDRRQAYTMGLESMVSQLKKDNVKLLKEEAERDKEKYKQLMDNMMNQVVGNPNPSKGMRRVCSMEW